MPLFAIDPPIDVAKGLVPPPSTIADLAGRHLAAIRAHRPDGPYRLFGYSFGGLVAFEMTRQLEAAGAIVEICALGDSPTISTVPLLRRGAAPAFTRRAEARRSYARFRRSGVRGALGAARLQVARLRHGHRRRRELARHAREGGLLAAFARDAYLAEIMHQLARGWSAAGPVAAKGLYVASTAGLATVPDAALFGGGLEVVSFDTDHEGLVGPTFGPQVGRAITDAIESRTAQRAASDPDRGD
jgi:pimeloyl-ACP methyl ester carboxylesterase